MASRANIIRQRMTASEVLYIDSMGPARCDRCMHWVEDAKRCVLHGPKMLDQAFNVCGLFTPGTPTLLAMVEQWGSLTPEESGWGIGDTTCGNCRYGDGSPTCQHPCIEEFPINNVGGCCNAWTARPGEPDREAKPRMG